VYWLKIEQEENFKRPKIKFVAEFPEDIDISSVKSYDVIVSDKPQPVEFEKSDNKIIINELEIGDYPLIIEFVK